MYYTIYWKDNINYWNKDYKNGRAKTKPVFEIFKTKKDRKNYYDHVFHGNKDFEDMNPQFIDIKPKKLLDVIGNARYGFHGELYELLCSTYSLKSNTNSSESKFENVEHNLIFKTKKDRHRYYINNIRGSIEKRNAHYFTLKGSTVTREIAMPDKNYSFH